jgi:hypothetical protein
MTFKQRQINLQFSGEKGDLELTGLRCHAIVANPGGFSAYGQLQLRVWGMTLEQMNQYSSTGINMVAVQNRSVTVSAGDVDGPMTQVFKGTLIRSFIDFATAPDVCFVCSAVAGYFEKAKATAPNSYQGAQNAEDIIKAIAVAAGFQFKNNGAHAVLQNQYVSGSAVDQMQAVGRAAAFPLVIENGTVTIWPNDGTRDDVVIELGPKTGLVGYPTFWEAGFVVKSEFNPLIANGRTVKLTSSIPKANGSWPTQNVTHELSTLSPDGPWFTTARLAPSVYVPVN